MAETSPDEFPEGRGVRLRYIVPRRITFDLMLTAANIAVKEVRAGNWGKGNIKAYLSVVGIQDRVIDGIWKQYAVRSGDGN